MRCLHSLPRIPLVLLLACSSSSETGGAVPADGGAADAAKGDPTVLVGSFQLRLAAPDSGNPGTTSLVGKIYDGATLVEVIDETALSENGCVLSTPRVPFCATPCGGSAACVENDTCKRYPLAHSAGVVTVTGVKTSAGAASFTMNPVVNAYQPIGVTLGYPAFAEGDAVKLEAAGDYYAAFTLEAKGVAQLVTPATPFELTRGQPATLEWTAPASAASGATMKVKLDISHHGGTKGKIACDVPDTGSLTLSATMIGKLLDLGVAGYPTVILTRTALGSATIAPGRVDLQITSEVERAVTVSGLTSCTDSTTCPTGTTCQADLTCK